MAELPSASVIIDDEAGAFAGGTGYCVVFGCAAQNADAMPRVFASTKSFLDTHGYSPAADYVAQHLEETKKPVIFVPLAIATVGVASAVTFTGTGTSVVTLTGTPVEETVGSFTVITGGTIGTDNIVGDLSLDGGFTKKRIRLGTANSYAIPYVGMTLHFAAGTLVAGDKAAFTSSAPMWDSSATNGLTAGRVNLAAQQKLARSWLVVGDLTNSTFGGYVVTEANAYETANDRFVYARAQVLDRTSLQTFAQYVSATDTAFATIDGQKRVDLGLGRGRKVSPITGWAFRRPVQWAASIREYQHDVQIPCWRKSDGPLNNFDLTDGTGQVVEYDERTIGGALAARFTCARTYSNGPNGAFIALSLTRDTEGSLLSRTHNMAVADVACSVVQAETENMIGQVLVLNDDGTGTTDSLQKLEERVNSQLQIALLQNRVEGVRASKAVWSASKTDVLNVPGATLTGTLDLELNGTLEKISTRVRIQTAG